MPFTLAHAAAAIPLARVRALPLPALVLGTMVPDWPMFARVWPSYQTTHSLLTCLPAGVPLGLLLLVAFEWARAPAIALLPRSLRVRLADAAAPRRVRTWRALAASSAALALGIVTHVVWDAFTHEDGWAVAALGLSAPWLQVGELSLPAYKLLQYLCSAFGLALVALFAWRWTCARSPAEDAVLCFTAGRRVVLWIALLLIAPALCAVRAWTVSAGDGAFLRSFAYELVTTSVAIDIVIVIAARALLRPRRSAQPSSSSNQVT